MLKIRLSRTGKRNEPSFRIVVTRHTAPVKSGYIEHIGFYNPQSKEFKIDEDKLSSWLKKGAKPSDTINNLLVREKIFKKNQVIKITRVPKKSRQSDASDVGIPTSASGKEKEKKAEKAAPVETKEKKVEEKDDTASVEAQKEEKPAQDKKEKKD